MVELVHHKVGHVVVGDVAVVEGDERCDAVVVVVGIDVPVRSPGPASACGLFIGQVVVEAVDVAANLGVYGGLEPAHLVDLYLPGELSCGEHDGSGAIGVFLAAVVHADRVDR